MTRTLDDHLGSGVNLRPLIVSLMETQGRNFNICELCNAHIPKGNYNIHHTKYEGATYYDLRIVCRKCDKQPANRNLN